MTARGMGASQRFFALASRALGGSMGRRARIEALVIALCACDVSAGGLNRDGIEPEPIDASEPAFDAAETDVIADASADAEPDVRGVEDPCPLSGTYALTLDATVHWEGTSLLNFVPIILPGNGQVAISTLIQIADTPEHAVAVRACDAQVPDFAASIGEVYKAEFPHEVWEALPLRWTTRAHFGCANSGCAFTAEPVIAQLGIDIPTNAPWPAARDPIPPLAQRDDDGDGLPGVLVRMRGPALGTVYQHPPTSFLLQRRVSEIQLAIRLGATLDGTLSSCDTRSGLTTAMTLEIRALACRVDGGMACTQDELGFVDDNLPVWTVQSATFRASRLPANATCADVRASAAMIGSP